VTDPIGTIKDSREYDAPMSIEAVQRRAERAQRGIEAPAMSAYQLQLAGYGIERTPRVGRDGRTTNWLASGRVRRRRAANPHRRRWTLIGAQPEMQVRRRAPMSPVTVRVDRTRLGAWEVAMPDQGELVTCETLEDAERVAYLCAARRRPCELIVCDAYHRVLQRVLIDGHHDPAGTGGRGDQPAG
jgi:hypothetical protein